MKFMMFGSREEEKEYAQKWAEKHDVEVTTTDNLLNMDTVKTVQGFDGLLIQQGDKLESELYPTLSKMGIKQIATRSAGFDMFDLDKAREHQLIVTNVPAYSPNAIAEFAVTSALTLIRHLNQIQENMQNNDFLWKKDILSKELRTMKIGIAGTGRIGRVAAQLFAGFGAEVIGFDLYPNDEATSFLTYTDTLEELVREADLISIHMPATDENHHLFNKELFAQMKDGAFLVNTARGSIVDTQALIDALDSGKLGGAGLDTYENEHLFVNQDWIGKNVEDELFNQLRNRLDVLFTPHIAFYTETAVTNIVEGALNATYEVVTKGDSPFKVN